MTPAARYAAAIDVLDRMSDGPSAEKSMAAWGRANRYAGSKDRAAVRDIVYAVLRQNRSLAHLGGGPSPRNVILGHLRRQGIDPDEVFGAGGYAPLALTTAEKTLPELDPPADVACDIPAALWPMWCADLGTAAHSVAHVLQNRAPITLRVNTRRGTRDEAQAALAAEGVATVPVAGVKTALQVTENERRIANSAAYKDGRVELQDVASQQAVAALDIPAGATVLDYCAGGGGKALALADLFDARIFAHDIAAARTNDIGPRAARAGVKIEVLTTAELPDHAPFDVVFCDAPCSGSGTWRRTPEAKWDTTLDKVMQFNDLQGEVLRDGASYVEANGTLLYATCSVFSAENDQVIDRFLADHAGWSCMSRHLRLPDALGDGFYFAVLQKG